MTRYTTNIPLAREQLLAVANEVERNGDIKNARRIRKIVADLMKRKFVKNKSRDISTPITPELRQEILRMYNANPDMASREIAEIFNVADGRVSEIIHMASTIPANIRRRT